MGLCAYFQKDRTIKKALGWGLLAGVITGAYSLTLPNRYSSEILALPDNGQGSLSAMTALANMAGIGKQDDAFYTDILTSHWLAEGLVDTEYKFSYMPWYFGGTQARKQTLAAFLGARTPVERQSAIKQAMNWVSASQDLKTGVLHIKVEAPSPELAQAMTNRAADLLDDALKNRVQSQGSAKAAYAKQRLARAVLEEEQARQDLVAFAQSHQNFPVSPNPAVRSEGEKLTADLMLRRQISTTVALGYEQAELDARSTVPILSRLSNAYLPVTKSGPRRTNMVLGIFLAAAVGAWLWMNRVRLRDQLHAIEDARNARPGA